MPTALVYYEGPVRIKELVHSLSNLESWDICLNSAADFQLKKLLEGFKNFDLHFIIFSRRLELDALGELYFIRNEYPFTFIIYYNSYLVNQQFLKLSELGINCCLIGVQRQNYLQELLMRVWKNHWKKIPEDIYVNPKSCLSPRAKKILSFIENRALTQCNTKNISRHLKISQSHLRAEFRDNFGINFREFKHNLLAHYESVLLLENNHKPNQIFRLLSYSSLANLSRSFRSRHGESWRSMSN
jgi:AraC-like DNA-binding protein